MKTRRSSIDPVVVARLEDARRQFERWRQSRIGRSRVPSNLWDVAAEVARECGAYRTARELHLNYNGLKNRIEPTGPRVRRRDPDPAAFVEIVPPSAARFSECTVEIEHRNGAKIKIHLTSPETPDLGAIGNAFLMACV
jgi:hypothetical protein